MKPNQKKNSDATEGCAALTGSDGRVYAPNGVIYQDGHAVGFYDTAESMGIMTDEDLAEAKTLIADLAERRRKLEAAGQWNPRQTASSAATGSERNSHE